MTVISLTAEPKNDKKNVIKDSCPVDLLEKFVQI